MLILTHLNHRSSARSPVYTVLSDNLDQLSLTYRRGQLRSHLRHASNLNNWIGPIQQQQQQQQQPGNQEYNSASGLRLKNDTLNLYQGNQPASDDPADRLANKEDSNLAGLLDRYLAPLMWAKSPILQVVAIRLIRVDAPTTIQAGQPLRLRCLYETRGDKLQSLSWYRNGREFYRYQPFERRQPVLAFNLTGVNVDVSNLSIREI